MIDKRSKLAHCYDSNAKQIRVAKLDLESHVAKDSNESMKAELECISVEIFPVAVPESQVLVIQVHHYKYPVLQTWLIGR